MTTAAVIVESPGFDPTADISGASAIKRLVHTFKSSGVKRVMIVSDEFLGSIEKNCTKLGADFVPREGMYDTLLKSALVMLGGRYDRLIAIPAKFALVDAGTVQALMGADAAAAVPSFGGKRGWPLLVASSHAAGIKDTAQGLFDYVRDNAADIIDVPTDDVGAVMDITAADEAEIRSVASAHSLNKVHLNLDLALDREYPFLGHGIVQLLRLIDENHRARVAFRMLGMAASHAYGLIHRAEEALGFKLLEPLPRARHRFRLTAECRGLLDKFEQLEATMTDLAVAEFDKVFKGTFR